MGGVTGLCGIDDLLRGVHLMFAWAFGRAGSITFTSSRQIRSTWGEGS
jgi:hypothetical protein